MEEYSTAPSYLRSLLTSASDVHHYHTRGAARGHVNQARRGEYGEKAISYQISPIKEHLLTDTLVLRQKVIFYQHLKLPNIFSFLQ